MKNNLQFFPLSILAILFSFQNTYAQSASCHSGKLDARVSFVLQYMPDQTLEQERAIPVAEKRKQGPPDPNPLPKDKMQQIKITADSLPLTIFRTDHSTKKSLPIIIDYHGGAFFIPYQPYMNNINYAQANDLEAIVFAVDYRVAPENKFPIPVTDCYNTFKWVLANAHKFGGDTSKIILSGTSAGGNLAAVVSLLAREEGLDKKIKIISLFCPAVDNPINSSYPSFKENGKGYGITKNMTLWATENYSNNLSKDTSDFRMFPIKVNNFSGLPPTLVFTAEFDVFRDEGAAYANKLKAAGVPVHLRCFPGQLHVMMALPPYAVEWKQMTDDIKIFMKKYLQK